MDQHLTMNGGQRRRRIEADEPRESLLQPSPLRDVETITTNSTDPEPRETITVRTDGPHVYSDPNASASPPSMPTGWNHDLMMAVHGPGGINEVAAKLRELEPRECPCSNRAVGDYEGEVEWCPIHGKPRKCQHEFAEAARFCCYCVHCGRLAHDIIDDLRAERDWANKKREHTQQVYDVLLAELAAANERIKGLARTSTERWRC